MGLNKSTGNMYPWLTHTWNPVGGRCSHDCSYCYMKDLMVKPVIKNKYSGNPHLVEKELIDLGRDRYIFVENCSDLFAKDVPDFVIQGVLRHCSRYDNKYLFQSKNPGRFKDFTFPPRTGLATTIETNDQALIDKVAPNSPKIEDRAHGIGKLPLYIGPYPIMISVEPVMKFDLQVFAKMLIDIKPDFVSIGADSKGNRLQEPTYSSILELKSILEGDRIEVKLKSNLQRLQRGT